MSYSVDYQNSPNNEYHFQINENTRYKPLKGRYVDTPFRVDETLEKKEETKGKVCLETFQEKGGFFYHLDPNKVTEKDRFVLLTGDIVYPSCSAGFNRSQTLHALLSYFLNSIILFEPHATRRGFDPYNDQANWHINKAKEKQPDEFKLWAQKEKAPRFGFDQFEYLMDEHDPSPEILNAIRKFYDEHYFGAGSITNNFEGQRRVYITFAQNVHVILHRLNQNNADLNNVVVVSIDLDDYIDKPQEKIIASKSQAAYAIFAQILRELIDFSQL